MNKFNKGDKVTIVNSNVPNTNGLHYVRGSEVYTVGSISGVCVYLEEMDSIPLSSDWLAPYSDDKGSKPMPKIIVGDLLRISGEDGYVYPYIYGDVIIIQSVVNEFRFTDLDYSLVEEVYRNGEPIWIKSVTEPEMDGFLDDLINMVGVLIKTIEGDK